MNNINNITFSWKHSNLSKLSVGEISLLIEISNSNLSFAKIEKASNTILEIVEFAKFSNEEILIENLKNLVVKGYNYSNVYVNYFSEVFTLVPKTYYSESEQLNYLKLNHNIKTTSNIESCDLPAIEARIIYEVDATILEAIKQDFPNYKIKHSHFSFIENLISLHKSTSETKAWLNLRSDFFDIAIYSGKLNFINSYKYQSAEDLLYFLMLALQQNNFNTDSHKLVLSGNINKADLNFKLLDNYFKHIELATLNNKFIKEEMPNIPNQHYFTLLNRLLCE